MSQHIYKTTYQNRPLKVLMGWDRPLSGYFCVLAYEDSNDFENLYSNLEDPKLLQYGGLPPTIEPFLEKLQELGIEVPEAILDEVEMDGIFKMGNRVVVYDEKGLVKTDSAAAATTE